MTDKYTLLKEKKQSKFDTFLCHNSKDKAEVMELFNDLLDVGILAWIDEKELEAGSRIISKIEKAVKQIPSVVIVLGDHGQGIFQKLEYETFIDAMIYDKKKIVPVTLKNCSNEPDIPSFLKPLVRLDFRNTNKDNLGELYKGIVGKDLLHVKVFIAEVNTPLEKDRTRLKKFLQQFRVKILPEESNFRDPARIDKAIEDCLNQTDFFVQILDHYEWKMPGGSYDGCLVEAQFNCAKRKLHKNRIFRWASTDIYEKITKADSERLLTGRFEDFKYRIRDEAQKLLNYKSEKVESSESNHFRIRPKVFVRRVENDSDLAKDIFTKLMHRYNKEPKIKIRYLSKFKNTEQREKFLRSMIETCSVLIIIYANSDAVWVDNTLDESEELKFIVHRNTLPILILKHPADKDDGWMHEDDSTKFVTYSRESADNDIKNLIKEIDTILESSNG